MTGFPWRSLSVAMWTRQAVLPTPLRDASTPMFPRPSPPSMDFSRLRMGLLWMSSALIMMRVSFPYFDASSSFSSCSAMSASAT